MKFGNVLVTGGAGFIGSQLVYKLLPISSHIYILDDLSTGQRSAIPTSPQITFIEDSITNQEVLRTIMPKVEYILHLACSNLLKSITSLDQDFNTNLYGGFTLLEHAHSLCPNLKRFVYTSTASIYGHAPYFPTSENHYKISLPYAASKFSMEHYCDVFFHMYNLPTTILRLSNVYGPGQSILNPYCGVVAQFFENAQKKKPLIIFDNGQQTRDFTYIDDALDAILFSMVKERAIGQVYNVGTGIETSVIDLGKEILRIVGFSEDAVEFKSKRIIDIVGRRSLDTSKIENDLQWQAKVSLTVGLQKTLKWLQEEQDNQ